MVTETERDLTSEAASSVQEEASAAEAQEALSAAEEGAAQEAGAVQEPDAAMLKAEIERLRSDLKSAQAGQSAADKALRAQEAQRYQQQQAAARRIEDANEEELVRQLREDPDAAERLAADLEDRKKAAVARAEGMQAQILQEYNSIMFGPRFDMLTVEDKVAVRQAMDQKYASPTLADLAHELAVAATEKAAAPNTELASRLKMLEEELQALKAANAGTNLRASGGPGTPVGGGAGAPGSYAERVRRGEAISPDEVDRLTAKLIS